MTTASTLLSHEWLAPVGGSENVFEQLIETFPEASRVCLWNDAPQRFSPSTTETWLAGSPLRRSKAAALPFMRSAWKKVDLHDYETVVSSSHAFGHHLAGRAAREGREAFAYVHSPARYIWAPEHDERGRGLLKRAAARPLQRRDRAGTHAEVKYAANSEFVRERIHRAWDRDAEVIHPPVDVDRIQSGTSWQDSLGPDEQEVVSHLPETFVLGASRLVEYKRLDLAITVGADLGLPVVIAGVGPDEPRLRSMAESSDTPVHFVGRVSDEMLYWLYDAASLFVFLAIEDFGIMPVEAIAAGTPVLVNAIGGASEIVDATGGGSEVDVSSPANLREGARQALRADMTAATLAAQAFSLASFRERVSRWTASDANQRSVTR